MPDVEGLATYHFVSHHEDDGRDVEPRSAGKGAGDQEDCRRRILRSGSKTEQQILVDGDDAKIVVGLDENVGDDDAGENGAEGQLRIGEVALLIAFTRRPQECRRTYFRGQDRCQHRPPGNIPVAYREALEILAPAPFVEPDRDDNGEVKKDDEPIDQ